VCGSVSPARRPQPGVYLGKAQGIEAAESRFQGWWLAEKAPVVAWELKRSMVIPAAALHRPVAFPRRRDIIRYHEEEEAQMTDVLIRDVPDDVIAALDSHASRLGLSRSEYVRRRLAQDAVASGGPVSTEDLERFASAFSDLADPEVTSQAWQ
jgi:hypothetical protein